LNTSPPFPETELDVNEVFGEFRLPLLRDLPLVDNLEISGAYRYSEYSTIDDGVETYSLQGQYRPVRDVLFRTTYGQATRIPTLSENFDPGGQTFGNGLSDPCDAVQLQSSAVPATIQANRRANCIALLGAGYDPNTTRIVYPAGVPGTSRGNLDLQPEDGRSYTFGAVITPRFIPRFSFVLDYYNIKISDVIFSVGAQDLLNNCVSGDALNPAACGLLFRNGSVPTPGGIPFGLLNQTGQIGFIATSLNYAALEAQGIDFQTRYAIDTADLLGGRDFGRLDYSLRGNYLIRQEDFINASDPGDARENDSLVGSPRVRFLSTLTYTPRENLSVTWDWDWQASQELRDSDLLLTDVDSRSADLLETESFSQHDFSVRYEVRDGITLRAGVVNAFDAEPPLEIQTGLLDSRGLAQTTLQLGDNFDFFGRRFFVGANLKLGAARD
jgi:outer membrane receptor protein involved in Fe transport